MILVRYTFEPSVLQLLAYFDYHLYYPEVPEVPTLI